MGIVTEYEYDKDRKLSRMTVKDGTTVLSDIVYENNHYGKPDFNQNIRGKSRSYKRCHPCCTIPHGDYSLVTTVMIKTANLSSQVSDNGAGHEFTYNNNNLQTTVRYYESESDDSPAQETFSYDYAGHVIQSSDKNGNTTRFLSRRLWQSCVYGLSDGRTAFSVYDYQNRKTAEVSAIDYTGSVSAEHVGLDTLSDDISNLSSMNRTEYTIMTGLTMCLPRPEKPTMPKPIPHRPQFWKPIPIIYAATG